MGPRVGLTHRDRGHCRFVHHYLMAAWPTNNSGPLEQESPPQLWVRRGAQLAAAEQPVAMAREGSIEAVLQHAGEQAKRLDASAAAAKARADPDDRLHRRVGFAIRQVEPSRGIDGVEAIVGKDGTAEIAANGRNPELAAAVEPANQPGRTRA